MQLSFLFATVIVFLTEVSWANTKYVKRRYDASENDPYRIKYLLVEDSDGNLHTEDLTKLPPEFRLKSDTVTIYLYTQNNIDNGTEVRLEDSIYLEDLELFDPNHENYFIIHGWNNNYESNVNKYIKNAILKTNDVNVFVIDWSEPANKFYTTAFSAVPKVGQFVGEFINDLMNEYYLSPKLFKLIGHSLGAHIAGCAGAAVNGSVDYIVGLDPAGPLFSLQNKNNRLDPEDADFVQVIHTSLLGFISSIGHVDFFPNNGIRQPGCGLDLLSQCAHSRSYIYYEESILHGGFKSTKCHNYDAYMGGHCHSNHISFVGALEIDDSAFGDYYLITAQKPPFSITDQ